MINFSRKLTLFLAILSAFLCFSLLDLLGFDNQYPISTLMLSLLLVPLMVSMRLHASFMRGFQKSSIAVLYESTLREVLLLIFVGGIFLLGFPITTGFEALVLLVIALTIVSVISWAHTRYILSNHLEQSQPLSFQSRDWIKISLPMMFIMFAQRLLRRSDIIILGLITNPALVGAYAIAAQFSDVGSIGQKGIFAVFSARAASLYQAGSTQELKQLYRKMQLYGVITTGGMIAFIAAFSPVILSFFGSDYIDGYHALLILLGGQFLNVCFGPVGVLMIMTAYEKMSMKFTFMAAFGNILFNPLAIYLFGLEGAAFVTSFFLVLRALLSYIFVKKQNLI